MSSLGELTVHCSAIPHCIEVHCGKTLQAGIQICDIMLGYTNSSPGE